jgi:glycerophosphoryl diester phosphodiesterase
MPESRTAERLPALLIVCALALACVVVIMTGVTPSKITAQELWGSARAPGERAFIASHRGGAEAAPENTLPAVAAALAAGFEYVEVDLALTADGHAVLMHDATVDRTTDGEGLLARLTLAEVRSLDAGSWYAPRYAGTPVPTAEEFLDLLAERDGRALLDLKGAWTADAAAALADAVTDRHLQRRVIVASFDARTLALVAARADAIPRMAILRTLPADVVQATREVDVRGVIVNRAAVAARPEIVAELHEADLRVVVYTLNDDRHWDAAVQWGVDGIVTDDPGALDDWQRGIASE